MTIKDISKGGATVAMVMTYCQADLDCLNDIPYAIKEYLSTMIAAPRHAIVLQSIQRFGARATMLALREKQQIDGFMMRSHEANMRKVANGTH